MSGKGKIWKLLAKVLGVLLSAALLVLAAVSLILAKPEEQPPAFYYVRVAAAKDAFCVKWIQNLNNLVT